tara:strand:- start:156 stop:485 length:330 start_codon:yes stop_codon:yes gene_type:complete
MLPFDTSVRSYRFYVRDTVSGGGGPALTADFADAKFVLIDKGDGKTNFWSQGIVIANDHATREIRFSFDGITVEGDIKSGETMSFSFLKRKVVYLRGQTGAEGYRLWAW